MIDAGAELIDFLRFNVQYALEAARWQPQSTSASENQSVLRGMEGFWAALTPFNFTAIGGNLASAPAIMVSAPFSLLFVRVEACFILYNVYITLILYECSYIAAVISNYVDYFA